MLLYVVVCCCMLLYVVCMLKKELYQMTNCSCYPAVQDGKEFNHVIGQVFGECVYTRREIASFFVGMSSLLFWIACQLPQFKKNYEKKSASALSKWFLLEWFLGDALNLVGAVLTHQLTTQIATAFLFIINDTIMILQMVYYTYYGNGNLRRRGSMDSRTSDQPLLDAIQRGNNLSPNSLVSQVALAAITIPVVGFVTTNNNKIGSPLQSSVVTIGDSLTNALHHGDELPDCQAHGQVDEIAQHMGVVIGWISAIVYLNSRLPQILKNYSRKSVEGLSFLMFFCAVMGNTTYGLGVLLRDASWSAINKALPWLVGSLGTLVLDFTILLQFWYYSDGDDDDDEDEVDDEGLGEGDGQHSGQYDRLNDNDDDDAQNNRRRRRRRRSAHDQYTDALRQSPKRGLFGMRAWETSPFFKHRPRVGKPPPLDLRDTTSLGVLPSETSSSRFTDQYNEDGDDEYEGPPILRRNASQSDFGIN